MVEAHYINAPGSRAAALQTRPIRQTCGQAQGTRHKATMAVEVLLKGEGESLTRTGRRHGRPAPLYG
jgi:hypothetical protein